MSLQTWKDEFYQESAKNAAKRGPEAALDHSVVKWDGLKPENTEKHAVVVAGIGIEDKDEGQITFYVEGSTCALCVYNDAVNKGCAECVLAKSRDGVACDDSRDDERRSPYKCWTYNADPFPMIEALRKAKVYAGDKGADKGEDKGECE